MTELVSMSAMVRALAPELLLAGGAMVLLLAGVWSPARPVAGRAEGGDQTSAIARFGMVLCLLVGLVVVIAWGDSAVAATDRRIASDGFRWAIDLVLLLGTLLALVLVDEEHHRSGAFGPEVPVLMLLSATGMMVLAAARDLMLIFLGLELMSLAIYVLAGSNRRSARGAEAAIKYFLLGAISSGFLLYGMAFLYGATGSTRLSDIGQWIATQSAPSPLLLVGMALLLIGLAFKIAAAPFHFWTPDAYDGAPLPITAFMSACVKMAAFATITRVLLEALPGAAASWHRVLWWIAAITMVVGNVLALSQRNLVRMLAYSSIAHAGYLLVTVIVASAAGTGALVFYGVSYTLATMGAFAVLVAVNAGRDQAPTIDDVAGLWLVRPWMAATLAVCLLAMLGMPLVGGMGFFAKWYVLQAALQAKAPQTVLAVILVLSSAVSAAYYLSVITAMFMRPRSDSAPIPHGASSSRLLMASIIVTLLLLGVFPTPLMRIARRALVDAAPAAPTRPDETAAPMRLQTASTVLPAPLHATH